MNWDPTDEEEVLQNVQNLCVTVQGTQPMARALGIPASVDRPLNAAQAAIRAALVEQVALHEPRAEISRIIVAGDESGRLIPTVCLK